MSSFFARRALGATAFALLLSGCSVSGTYPDAIEPDAAKLRFSSDMSSSTLALFDEQHCGPSTGKTSRLIWLRREG